MNPPKLAGWLAAFLLATAHMAAAEAPVPTYKPSARSPTPVPINTDAYGYSASAPQALGLGDTVPDFTAPGADGRNVSLAQARRAGPVAIIFYRGHW